MRACVVIPAYNAADTIERTVLAVLAQGGGVEAIVCDDGSTDETADVAERLGATVLRLPHGGQSIARNAGIERANADVVVFCDADDWLADGAVERMLAGFEPGVGVVAGRVEVVGEAKPRWWPRDTFTATELTFDDLLRANYIALGSAAIRSELAREIGFDPALNHTMDYNLWLRAARRAKIRWIPDVLAFVDRSKPSLSSDREGALRERIVMLERLVPDVATRSDILPPLAKTATDLARMTSSPVERWRWRRRARAWEREATR